MTRNPAQEDNEEDAMTSFTFRQVRINGDSVKIYVLFAGGAKFGELHGSEDGLFDLYLTDDERIIDPAKPFAPYPAGATSLHLVDALDMAKTLWNAQRAMHVDAVVRRWGHDDCHYLTLALHRATGWPIMTLHDGRIRCGRLALDDFGSLVHSGVTVPDGSFLDVRGVHRSERDRLTLAELYIHYPSFYATYVPDVSEAELLEKVLGTPEEIETLVIEAAGVISDRLATNVEMQMPDPGEARSSMIL
jgi:hypothetical protein